MICETYLNITDIVHLMLWMLTTLLFFETVCSQQHSYDGDTLLV